MDVHAITIYDVNKPRLGNSSLGIEPVVEIGSHLIFDNREEHLRRLADEHDIPGGEYVALFLYSDYSHGAFRFTVIDPDPLPQPPKEVTFP